MKYAKVVTPEEKAERFKHHASTVLRGLFRTVFGALIAFAFGLSVFGFSAIGTEAGYDAVGDFVVSCLLMVLGCIGVYVLGWKKVGE